MKKAITATVLALSVLVSTACSTENSSTPADHSSAAVSDTLATSATSETSSPSDSEESGESGELEVLSIHAEYPYYESFAVLEEKADIIFTGTITEIAIENAVKSNLVNAHTVYTATVKTTYKGETLDTISFTQYGTNQLKNVIFEEFLTLEKGVEYVFVLEKIGNLGTLVTPFQGAFTIEEDKVVSANEDSGFSFNLSDLEGLIS